MFFVLFYPTPLSYLFLTGLIYFDVSSSGETPLTDLGLQTMTSLLKFITLEGRSTSTEDGKIALYDADISLILGIPYGL